MKVLIFGATGMVGQGVLHECLDDAGVAAVTTVGRSATGVKHPKLSEIQHSDLWNYQAIESKLAGFDACFFCLGVSSAGMKEADYRRITYDLTLAAAQTLARLNPQMTFVYVSGASTDSTEKGRVMWARVKGETENALMKLPFKAAYMFRPGGIEASHGEISKTKAYRVLYSIVRPIVPTLRRMFPRYMTSTHQMGQGMLLVARKGAAKRVLENWDINELK